MQSLIMYQELLNSLSPTTRKWKGFVMKGEWQIDRSISVGHILTTLALVASLVGVWSTMNTKIETQAVRISAVESRIDREAERQRQDMAQIRESLNRIEDRLERLAENK